MAPANAKDRLVEVLGETLRRNPNALAMDLLFLFTIAFFAHHLPLGWWPAAIASLPLAALLYFGWRASRAFFGLELLVIAGTVVLTRSGTFPF